MHFSPRTWTSFPNPKTNPAPPAPLRRAPPWPVACWSALNLQLRFDDHHGTFKQGILASSKGRGSRTQKNKKHVNPPFGSGLGLSCWFFPGKKRDCKNSRRGLYVCLDWLGKETDSSGSHFHQKNQEEIFHRINGFLLINLPFVPWIRDWV